jgi:alkylation response protein AidB-like acyl-CoA dehydrogenase
MHGQFQLTDDQLAIREVAQRFTADQITPHAGEWDEKHIFPRETIQRSAELGFGAIYVSEASGGIGLGRLEAALIMEAGVSPARLAEARIVLSAVLLLGWLLWRDRPSLRLSRREILLFAVFGIIGLVGVQWFYFEASDHLDVVRLLGDRQDIAGILESRA